MKNMEKYLKNLVSFSIGIGYENGKPVEKTQSYLPVQYRRDAFYETHPDGRIYLEIKEITAKGVRAVCSVYKTESSIQPKAIAEGFYPGNDVMAFMAAQTKAEQSALARAGFFLLDEVVDSEELIPAAKTTAPTALPVVPDNIPVLGADGIIHDPTDTLAPVPVVAIVVAPKVALAAPVQETMAVVEPEKAVATAKDIRIQKAKEVAQKAAAQELADFTPPAEVSVDVSAEVLAPMPETMETTVEAVTAASNEAVYPVGKFKGKTVGEVLKADPTYLKTLQNQCTSAEKKEQFRQRSPELLAFLEEQNLCA